MRRRYDEKLGEKQNWYIIFIIDISGDCSESFQFLISGRPSAVSLEVILLYFFCHCFLPSLSNFFSVSLTVPSFCPTHYDLPLHVLKRSPCGRVGRTLHQAMLPCGVQASVLNCWIRAEDSVYMPSDTVASLDSNFKQFVWKKILAVHSRQ